MEINDLLAKLETLDILIEALPRGSITTKRVKGHIYHYLRWYEGKTRRESMFPKKNWTNFAIRSKNENHCSCREKNS